MAAILRKIFGLYHRKKATKRDSITGRNNSFPVPYLAKLENGQLEGGHSLVIRGIIIGRQNFTISLTNGPRVEFDEENDTLDDRLLSIRVEVDKRKIFLNACINGEWGKEGVLKHKWKLGEEFDIRIRCHQEEYEIFCDHKLVARFAHYLPLENITHVFITGDIELFSSSWEGTYYNVPYSAEIPGFFTPGWKFYVSGLAKKKAKEFFIDLLAASETNGNADIAFRLNPRFPSKQLLCNTRIGDEWQTPERLSLEPFGFKRARAFDILIYCEESKFIVYVDDCLVGSYAHHLNPAKIEKIQIFGDLVLQGVHLK